MPVAATFLDDAGMRVNGSEWALLWKGRGISGEAAAFAKDGDHKGITRVWGRRAPWQDWQDSAQAAAAPSAPPHHPHPVLGLATVL